MLKLFFYSFFLLLLFGCAKYDNRINIEKEISNERDFFLMVNAFNNKLVGTSINVANEKNVLIISDDKKTVNLIDIDKNKILRRYTGYIDENEVGNINSIIYNSTKNILVAGGYFSVKNNSIGNIRIYDFNNSKILFNLLEAKEEIKNIKVLNDKYLIGVSNYTIYIWDMDNYTLIRTINVTKKIKDLEICNIGTSNYIAILNEHNNLTLYDFDGQIKNNLSFNKTVTQLKYNKDTFIVIGDDIRNPEISVLNKDLSYKYKLILKDSDLENTYNLSEKNGISLKNISDIYALNKNDITTNTLIESLRPYLIKHIQILNNQLFVLTDKYDLISINLNNFSINDVTSYKNYNPVRFYIIDNNLFLQNEKLEISILNKNKVSNIEPDINSELIIEKIINEKVSVITDTFMNYKISNEIDSGYAYSEEELNHLKLLASKKLMFDDSQNIKRQDELFLFKNNMFIKNIKLSNFNTYGFLNNEILIGFNNGNVESFNLEGKPTYKLDKNINSIEKLYSSYKYLIIKDVRNVFNVYSKDTKKNILSCYIDKIGNYIVWTDEGYFTVSNDDALEYITWHLNQKDKQTAERYNIEKFYDIFFRPDLIKLKLQGEDISKYTNGIAYQEALKNPPPKISIFNVDGQDIYVKDGKKSDVIFAKDKVLLKFKVIDNSGGIGLIRLYQEGKLIKIFGNGEINKQVANIDTILEQENIKDKVKIAQQEYIEKMQNSVTKGINEINSLEDSVPSVISPDIQNKAGEYSIDLDLIAGKNEITIEAFNSSNTISSYKESINIVANIAKKEPTLYAIVGGVNEFEANYVSNLKYSENDAQSIKDIILQEKGKSYKNVEIKYLVGKDLTKENLNNIIGELKQKAKLEDAIVFYISTHGKNYKGKLMLVPQNNKNIKNLISFEDLFKNMQSIKPLKQIYILDTCESGSANDIVSSIYDSKASVLAKSSGVHMLLATTKGTYAFEHPNPNIRHGVFTNNILTRLNDKNTDKNQNSNISVIELSKTLQENEFSNEQQYPIIRNIGNDVPIKNLK